MKLLKQLLLLSVITLFIGCDDNEEDTTAPKIEIITPSENTEYNFGESIKIKMNFDDPNGVMEFQVEIFKEELTQNEFNYSRLITLATFVNNFTNEYEVLIPEKLDVNNKFDEGNYIIRIKASDYKMNIGSIDRKIKIVYPTEE